MPGVNSDANGRIRASDAISNTSAIKQSRAPVLSFLKPSAS